MLKQKQKPNLHTPVLLNEVIRCLGPKPGESYLDLTAGYGGHAKAVLAATKAPERAVLVDRDAEAVDCLDDLFAGSGVVVMNSDFSAATHSLQASGRRFDLILADLGLSSPHLNREDRGFSFRADGPLDMRMDRKQTLDAAQIVNEWSEEDIARILREYGEEPKANALASKILSQRPINTTEQLSRLVKSVYPGVSRVHPATRTFQALRIAVNDELGQLSDFLSIAVSLLAPKGRMAIISFHSLEDRLVKRFMAENAADTYDSELVMTTKKPLTPSQQEIDSNPRARSAKLRACRKK